MLVPLARHTPSGWHLCFHSLERRLVLLQLIATASMPPDGLYCVQGFRLRTTNSCTFMCRFCVNSLEIIVRVPPFIPRVPTGANFSPFRCLEKWRFIQNRGTDKRSCTYTTILFSSTKLCNEI